MHCLCSVRRRKRRSTYNNNNKNTTRVKSAKFRASSVVQRRATLAAAATSSSATANIFSTSHEHICMNVKKPASQPFSLFHSNYLSAFISLLILCVWVCECECAVPRENNLINILLLVFILDSRIPCTLQLAKITTNSINIISL